MRSAPVLLGACVCLGSCATTRPELPDLRRLSEQLPVRRVILYQNGVGYFEREGSLDGNVLTLRCRPHQINDLLKSLTVIDRGTGRPVSVSLPLEKSGASVLAEVPKQVREASGLLDILRVFRGARVTVSGEQDTVSGRVVGVEQDEVSSEGKPATAWRLTLKTDGGDLIIYPIRSIRRLSLLDRALEVGLDQSLDVSLDEGTWKPVTVSVRLAGKDTHQLLVSYIVEMPNWKPAYRLVLHSERQPLLQGWAVVDNISGESWTDSRLSLVAGTPMSFIYDLHAPRFTRRVDLTPAQTDVALAPTREEAGYAEAPTPPPAAQPGPSAKDMLQRSYARSRLGDLGSSGGAMEDARSESKPEPKVAERRYAYKPSKRAAPSSPVRPDMNAMNVMLEKQIETKVEGTKVAGLFRYDIKDPVTVPDSSSTLVNIVNTRVTGGEVVLFRPELTSSSPGSHPYRAVRFSNGTGFTLEQGPMTIYSEGTFVGEGFLERMEKGTTIFLTFAIDGNVTMREERGTAQEVIRLLKIARGQIESELLQIDRRVYAIANKHEKPITAYVKTSAPSYEYKLRRTPPETVTTPGATYVPITIPAGKTEKLVIEWVSPVRQWLAVDSSLAGTVLRLFSSTGRVPASIKPTLDKILAAKSRIDEIQVELARISQVKSELSADQDRVRANLELMRKIKGNAELKARLTKSLSKLEEQLSKLTSDYVKLDEEKAKHEGLMRVLIGEISFEAEK